jgi:hypothetical protein
MSVPGEKSMIAAWTHFLFAVCGWLVISMLIATAIARGDRSLFTKVQLSLFLGGVFMYALGFVCRHTAEGSKEAPDISVLRRVAREQGAGVRKATLNVEIVVRDFKQQRAGALLRARLDLSIARAALSGTRGAMSSAVQVADTDLAAADAAEAAAAAAEADGLLEQQQAHPTTAI